MRFVSDNDFRQAIIAGVRRRRPELEFDVVSVRELGLAEAHDLIVLEYAARENRILLTHDVNTLVGFAEDRVRAGLPMAGVFFIKQRASLRIAIDALEMACVASHQSEWEGSIAFLG